jgi:DNA repair protein RecO (recombination protein O)
VARNARQSRRRFGGALEPMTHGRVTYRERERRDLVFVQDIAPLRSPLHLAGSTGDALGHVGYFAELIDEWAPDNDPNETLFRLGVSVVEALTAGVAVEPLARYFEYWLLRLQGVYEADRRASAGARAFLEEVRTRSPLGLADVAVAPAVLRELEATHRTTIAMHLEKDLKSTRVLREMRR